MRLTTTYLLTIDAQDVFDVVAWHLLRQNAQSTAPGSAKCMYRAPDGKRCAIGWLIPDEVYVRSLEFFGVRDLAAAMSETFPGSAPHRFSEFLLRHMPLLRDLQGMHDAQPPYEWPFGLRAIAQRYRLRETVVDHMVHDDRRYAPPVPPAARRPRAPAYLLDLKARFAPEVFGAQEPEEVAW